MGNKKQKQLEQRIFEITGYLESMTNAFEKLEGQNNRLRGRVLKLEKQIAAGGKYNFPKGEIK